MSQPTIETTIWMEVTSEDLFEMARKARQIEQTARVGNSLLVKLWNVGGNTNIKVMVDQERAYRKGLFG